VAFVSACLLLGWEYHCDNWTSRSEVGVSVALVSSQLSTIKEWDSVLESGSCSEVGVPSDDGESDVLLDG
jgi:hypothetical protein